MHSTSLPRKTPETCGFSSMGIIDAINDMEKTGTEVHSLLIYAGDAVIFEGHYAPYDRHMTHTLHSLTKAVTNIAVGMLVADQRLSLTDRAIDFFPECAGLNDDPRMAAMTVENLLTMRNGHGRMISGNEWRPIQSSWIKKFFEEPIVHNPGEVFQYSSGNSYILSAIVQRVTGETTHHFLEKRLFQPMGIRNLTWDVSPDGVNPGGNGLCMTAEDLLKLGVLFLHGGVWEGGRLVDESWVDRCFGRVDRKPLPDGRSYGFHWWDLGYGYLAGGAFGQFVCVIPELDVVIAATQGTNVPVEEVTDRLYRGLCAARLDAPAPCPEDVCRIYETRQRTVNLLRRVDAEDVKCSDGRYAMDENEDGVTEVEWHSDGDELAFTLCDDRGRHVIRCGIGSYRQDMTDMTGHYLHHQYEFDETSCCACAVPQKNGGISMEWYFPQTPFHDWVTIQVEGDGVVMQRGTNVNSQSVVRPPITGRAIH